jgi:hypothetical protein
VIKHPEIVPYHNEISLVLGKPSVVVETGDERHFYRAGVGSGKHQAIHLRVVVGANNGWIRTVHFARRVKLANGRIVYQAQQGKRHE